jgi:2',3'-cyclic-nucleotide 2'-phosphodiesterase/3'-nucleotidase
MMPFLNKTHEENLNSVLNVVFMKFSLLIILFILIVVSGCNKQDAVVRLAVTTDVHGMIFPFDLVNREPSDHSLSHIYNYVSKQRELEDTLFFLLDNGDFLQGQPTVYYYNFVDTLPVHLSARVMNYMQYDAGTVGNHDIEAGPAVYNKINQEFTFPWLAANAVHAGNETPYFEPYTILKAGKKRIAVLGMITPGIPNWLPKNLWPDMEFRDMVESANEWIPRIKKEEDPDLIVGLFHSGTDASYGGNKEPYMNENAVLLVAEKVPGFDVIFAGHDHRVSIQHVVNSIGDSVLIVDPGSHARYAGQVTITFQADGHRKLAAKNIPMEDFEPSEDFNNHFSEDYEKVISYLDDTITWLSEDISGSDALFGPSSIISLIHEVQLDLSGADLSFTAPLSISAALEKGPVLVSDMFKLYRFENMLYTMELSGKEIDGFLEYAAELWFNTMTGPGDQLLRFDPVRPGRLAQPYYNFSTAAGIDYTVDLRQPVGHKITIHGFSDGEAFDDNATYMVAINSYRGNGGGGHLSSGAGIPKEELSKRIAWSTEIDLRYHLMKHLALSDTLHPEVIDNWSLTPEAWTSTAAERDRRYFR